MDYTSPFRRLYRRGGFHCDLCDCFTGWSPAAAQTHERGRRHFRRLRDLDDTSDLDAEKDGWCKVCQVQLRNTSPHSLQCHNQGRTHRILSEELVEFCATEKQLIVQGLLTARMHNSHEDVVQLILEYVEEP